MKADKIVFGALKALAGWVALNPDKAFDALDKAIHLPIAKKVRPQKNKYMY